MARAYGIRSQLAAAFETTYGTVPASGFYQLPFYSSNLSAEQPLIANNLLGYGRAPLPPLRELIDVSGDVVVPLDAQTFGFWLVAAFGQPNTTGNGPYTHTFPTLMEWSIPSISVEIGMPEVPQYFMYAGCRLNQLSWQMQTSGILNATASLIGQGVAVSSSSGAGSPQPPGGAAFTSQFSHFNGAILRNDTTLANIVSAEVNFTNNLDRVTTIRSDGKIDGVDPTIVACTGQIVARFADMTLLQQAIDGTSSKLEFRYTKSANESFELQLDNVYLPRPRLEIQGPQGIQVTFAFQAAANSAGGSFGSATLVNSVSSY